MTAEVQKVNEQAAASGGTAQSFLVSIPQNIFPGMQFTVNVSGQRFMVTCPPSAGPGSRVRIVPPALPEEPQAAPKTQIFEVAVPYGVVPGQSFALIANGQRVLVTCPPNVSPGQRIRFQLPVSEVVGNIQLSYESERSGWKRSIRVSDLKFQWVRLDGDSNDGKKKALSTGAGDQHGPPYVGKSEDGGGIGKSLDSDSSGAPPPSSNLEGSLSSIDVTGSTVCNFHRSAYVRKITYLEGNDARMRTGKVELVPASEAAVDSRLVVHSRTLLSYSDIAAIQGKGLDEKTEWFQAICAKLAPAWEDGHIKIVVRRRHLLLDSVDAIMSLGRDDLRKRWRIEFLGEPGIDAGGLTREWFELVTEAVYDPAFGLWLPSVNNQACVNINPASGMLSSPQCDGSCLHRTYLTLELSFHRRPAISCPDDHLVYFRFLGRVLGRALFDRQTVKGHMVRTLYKHLLGWPVTFEDILTQDEDLYKSLKKLAEMEPEHVACMCLDFTVTEESMGVRQDINLIERGNEKEVTGENVTEYLEANLKYRLLERTKPQLTELLLGFFDIIPEPALTVFDANELELILCGLPNIDIDDWKANTLYSGLYKGRGDEVVQWFWQVVTEEFDDEMKARLLQFVTGTSGVPSRGFAVLQGNDGNIKKFTIHGVDRETSIFPRSHTCFNRIDLPNYTSRKELHDKLKTAVTMCGVGFDME
jgi:E3 ubiquitin-protein ligase NEDD4